MLLSPKELKVLTLAALGCSDKEIAQELKIKYCTVRNHIDRAVLKLKAKNKSNAILIYKLLNRDWLEEYYETYRSSLDSRKLLPE